MLGPDRLLDQAGVAEHPVVEAIPLGQLDDGPVALVFRGNDPPGITPPCVEEIVPQETAETQVQEGGEGIDVRMNVDQPSVVKPGVKKKS